MRALKCVGWVDAQNPTFITFVGLHYRLTQPTKSPLTFENWYNLLLIDSALVASGLSL
jgi:hypothetical protein